MRKQTQRSSDELESVIDDYSNMIFKICLVMLCNEQDAEDALQEVFMRYLSKAPVFNESEHQKAWLIRVAVNICKDLQRFRFRHNHLDIDELSDYCVTDESTGIMETVMMLSQRYKSVILLYYVEGYDVGSIAEILGISVSAVKKRLQRGREMIKLEF